MTVQRLRVKVKLLVQIIQHDVCVFTTERLLWFHLYHVEDTVARALLPPTPQPAETFEGQVERSSTEEKLDEAESTFSVPFLWLLVITCKQKFTFSICCFING